MSSINNINYQNTLNVQIPFPINNQNTLKTIKIPFPPSIKEDEIIQLHLKNGIRSANRTMNAFMIYRKEFNNIVTNYNLELKDISLYASISWKNEPQHVKKFYVQLAEKVKELFKEKVPSLCFIHSTNDNNVSLDTFNSHLDNQNFPSLYDAYSNYQIFNINNIVYDDFENFFRVYMNMDDDKFMNYLSEDLALTYRAIVQSLP
ncbi:7030_t:CDS:1 [Diversispora eburnea]|uniref:7030_t:CDS:1 n=1 Tax=Diversispora eburnea TaxID=1213867 RepID=A0A9N9B2M2_9GLOM|nr:7030_t:CDS:1 [Diversispora eburnea]